MKYATKESQVNYWTNKGALGVWVNLKSGGWAKANKALAAKLLARKG